MRRFCVETGLAVALPKSKWFPTELSIHLKCRAQLHERLTASDCMIYLSLGARLSHLTLANSHWFMRHTALCFQWDSNPQPNALEAFALTNWAIEARPAVSLVEDIACQPEQGVRRLTGVLGSSFQSWSSPDNIPKFSINQSLSVRPPGLEPGTQALRVLCSTNWAKGACFLKFLHQTFYSSMCPRLESNQRLSD